MADDFESRFEAEEEDEFEGRFEPDEPESLSFSQRLDNMAKRQGEASYSDPRIGGMLRMKRDLGPEGFSKKVDEGLRTAVETVATGAAGVLGGGLPLLSRAGLALGAGGGASLGFDAITGKELDPERAAITGLAGVAGEGLGALASAGIRGGKALYSKAGDLLEEYGEPVLRKFAGEQAVASAGGRGRAGLRRVGGIEDAPDLGNRLIDQGIVTGGSSTAKAGQRAKAVVDEVGPQLGDLRKAADKFSYGPVSGDIRGQIEKVLSDYAPRSLTNADAVQLQGVVDGFKTDLANNVDELGNVNPNVLNKLMGQLDNRLRALYGQGGSRLPSDVEQLRLRIRGLLEGAEEESVGRLGKGFEVDGVEAGQAFPQLKQRYGDAERVRQAAQYAEEGEFGGGAPRGVGGVFDAAKNVVFSSRGRSAAAVGARRIADKLAARGVDVTSGPGAEIVSMLEWAKGQSPRTVAAAASVLLSQYPTLREPIVEAVQSLGTSDQ